MNRASMATGLQLGRAEAKAGLRNLMGMDKPENHRVDYFRVRKGENKVADIPILQPQNHSVLDQTNIDTLLKAFLACSCLCEQHSL